MENILEILQRNSKTTPEEIAIIIGKPLEEVKSIIKKLENDKVILSYTTLIDWEKTNKEYVMAIIEVRVTPQRGEGFDKVASRIYRFPEVTSCFLMSGGYDLGLVIEGRTMKEVALFVAEKLAPLDSVISTSTHFVLKKYKDHGIIFDEQPKENKGAIFV